MSWIPQNDWRLKLRSPCPLPSTATAASPSVSSQRVRYLVALHTGPYEGLQASTAWLKAWALERSIELDTSEDDTRWKGRIETYLTGPSKELDPSRWVTELAILTVSEGVPTPTANHPH